MDKGSSGGSLCCPLLGQFNGIWPQGHDFFRHFFGHLDKSGRFTGREIIHLYPLSTYAYLLQHVLGLFHPLTGPDIPAVEVTISFQAAYYVSSISPFFKGPEEVNKIYLSRAWKKDDSYTTGILKTHGTCQVRGCVSSELATERNNDGIKRFHITRLLPVTLPLCS